MTQTLNQSFNLLLAATTAYGGVGAFPDLFHRGCAIDDGIDDIDFGYLIADAEVLFQVFSENSREFINGIGHGIGFGV